MTPAFQLTNLLPALAVLTCSPLAFRVYQLAEVRQVPLVAITCGPRSRFWIRVDVHARLAGSGRLALIPVPEVGPRPISPDELFPTVSEVQPQPGGEAVQQVWRSWSGRRRTWR